jgi:hypothetical protein
MTLAEYVRRVRAGDSIPKDVTVPRADVHVRAAEGYLPQIDGLDAEPPELTQQDLAALLGNRNGDDQPQAR